MDDSHHPPHRPCGIEFKNRLGRYRWVVERTLSWLNRFRRLKIRYTCPTAHLPRVHTCPGGRCQGVPGGAGEHRADIHLAFLQPGCALLSLRFLG